MTNPKFLIMPFSWADEVPVDLDVAIRETFLDSNPYSIATYFRECTFGLVDIAPEAIVRPHGVLSLTHNLHFDAQGHTQSSRIRTEVVEAALSFMSVIEPGDPMRPDLQLSWVSHPHWIVFMTSPPSPAGALTGRSECVLDYGSTHSYMAHEIGHTIGWMHSQGLGHDYDDPYCIMSAETFGNRHPTHRVDRPANSQIPQPGTYEHNFWDSAGPMPAAATMLLHLPDFSGSGMVRYVGPEYTVTLKALSAARLGDPVLGVCEFDGVDWMAELRVSTGWDRGLDGPNGPGSAIVLHMSARSDSPRRANYIGTIPLADPRVTSFQPPGVNDVKLVLDFYDPNTFTAQIRFTRQPAPAAVGSPAPEFLPEAIDRECATPSSQVAAPLPEIYQLVRDGHGERARIHVVYTDSTGGARTALSQAPAADPGTGGIVMTAWECRDGRRISEWKISIVEFLSSYLVRIDSPGLDGELGSVDEAGSGDNMQVRSFRLPIIY